MSDQPLLDVLSAMFGDAFARLGLDPSYGRVVVSQRPELAQFQCNGAMPAAKPAERDPRDLAAAVVAAIEDDAPFSAVTVAGPGFINLAVTDEFLAGFVEAMRNDARLAVAPVATRREVVIDYGGANVAKEMHVGHLRPAIIGESLKRLFRFAGHRVTGDVHLGDWGAPMGQLIAEYEDRRPDLPYFDATFTGPYPAEAPVSIDELTLVYPVAAQRAKDDLVFAQRAARAVFELHQGRPGYRAFWNHLREVSVTELSEVYDELGVTFDLWHGESTIASRLDPMIRRLTADGVAVESDGALIIDVAEEGDTAEIPPMLLVKSDGATLYTTWDLATIDDRVDGLGADLLIYVVDVRQSLHFQQVFRAARRAGIAGPAVELEHAGNGTVNGPDGKPFKTRSGDLLLLRDLMTMVVDKAMERLDENELAVGYPEDERGEIARRVGLAALKYGDLQNHRTSDYIFDLDRFTSFEGKTGPYLLYGAVRIMSILRKAADLGLEPGEIQPATVDSERGLMLRLIRLPEVIERALEHRAPNHVAEFTYEVVTDFNRFYESCHILREEDAARQASWLGLASLTLRALEQLLDLLVIEIPERM